jgi:thiamine biosynthesis lipoprotein
MISSLPPTETIARARPLLGTVVTIRVSGLARATAETALALAFAEIERVHAAMSFQSGMSDVSRLNRMAHRRSVAVNRRTYAVLKRSLEIARESEGLFDPTVAPQLVARGVLHRPLDAPDPDASARFQHIALLPDFHVRFARPLWIDLSGIAKGYAVDQAMTRLLAFGPTQACVNAGGDLRVAGTAPVRIALAAGTRSDVAPMVELTDGALASSSGYRTDGPGTYVHGRSRKPVLPQRFASVAAPCCMDADALTKIVLADAGAARSLLCRHEARAYLIDPDGDFSTLGLAA